MSEEKSTEIPSVMKAAQQSNYGEARDVLKLDENVSVLRDLSSKEILVRVCAASINPVN
jgi:NADPH:quinone reductase-like Zn-dependent oxidoreductase